MTRMIRSTLRSSALSQRVQKFGRAPPDIAPQLFEQVSLHNATHHYQEKDHPSTRIRSHKYHSTTTRLQPRHPLQISRVDHQHHPSLKRAAPLYIPGLRTHRQVAHLHHPRVNARQSSRLLFRTRPTTPHKPQNAHHANDRKGTYLPQMGLTLARIFYNQDGTRLGSESDSEDWTIEIHPHAARLDAAWLQAPCSAKFEAHFP